MFGLFALFGRSRAMQQLDWELRAAGIHPKLVPEAVKIAALRLMKDCGRVADPDYVSVSQMIAYCSLGHRDFENMNDAALTQEIEARIAGALDGDNLDARLVLLALHSGLIAADVVEQFGLEAV